MTYIVNDYAVDDDWGDANGSGLAFHAIADDFSDMYMPLYSYNSEGVPDGYEGTVQSSHPYIVSYASKHPTWNTVVEVDRAFMRGMGYDLKVDPNVTYSGDTFDEAVANDGSIAGSVTLTLANDTFTGIDGESFITSSKATVTNVPAGLTAQVIRDSDTQLTLSLTGNATSHVDADDVANLTVTFADTAFTNTSAANVREADRSDLAVDFEDPYILANWVWNDLDDDGIQDAGESGINGAAVELFSSANAVVGDSDDVSLGVGITDAAGQYSFGELAAGTNYYLQFRTPVGDPAYAFTTQDAGSDDTVDSDADAVGYTTMFTPGASNLSVDTGLTGSAPNFGFALRAGTSEWEQGHAVAIDADGNTYVTGQFKRGTDFDPGPGTYDPKGKMFVAKYSSTGAMVWVRTMKSSAGVSGHGIAIAEDGGVLTTGYFSGTVDFDPEAGVFELSEMGSNAFVLKLDADGNFVWARHMGGSDGEDMATDNDGNIYITGTFIDTEDFDPGPGTYYLTGDGEFDTFVTKIDSGGDFVWARKFGGQGEHSSRVFGEGVTVADDGSVYTTGYFANTVDFDPGAGDYSLTSVGNNNVFVSKLDSDGNLVWVQQFGGTEDDRGRDIALAGDGSVYTTGYFSDTADFDPGAGTYDLTSAGQRDAFVSKLDSGGNLVWARQFGGTGLEDQGASITIADDGMVVTTGYFNDTVDFDPGAGSFDLTSAGGTDVFISKFDSAGNFLSVSQMGGTGWDRTSGIALANDGTVHTSGFFSDTADFDPGTGVFNLSSAGSYDIFVSVIHFDPDSDFGDGHTVVPAVFLGTTVDIDPNGQPTADATGDDLSGGDDEDGVTFTSTLTVGQTTNYDIVASVAGFLNAWIDFNDDGDWADAGEQIATDVPLVAGINSLAFDVPFTATATSETFARFRFDTTGGLSYDGPAADGEVEDYAVSVSRAPDTQFSAVSTLNTNAASDSWAADFDPQVTTDGSGNWVAVWRSNENLGGIGTDNDIFVSRSTDNGHTWTDPTWLNTNADSDNGQDYAPQITTDSKGNWVVVWDSTDKLGNTIGTDQDILVSRSTNNGLTWTDPVALNTNAATDSKMDRNAQVTTDAQGNWVAVWMSAEDLGGAIGTDADILVARSTNNGLTWTDPAALNTNASTDTGSDFRPQVTTDAQGNWVAVWYSYDSLGGTIGTDGDILVSRSINNGLTWTAPATLNTNAATDLDGDFSPQVTTDAQGNWVAVWDSWDDLGGTIDFDGDILVSRSTDAGLTWTAPAALNTNAASDADEDLYPQVTTDALGNWVAVWELWGSGGAMGTDQDVLVSRSTDNGLTWSEPAALNTAASDSEDDFTPQVSTDLLGNWVAVWASNENLGGTIGTDRDIFFATAFLGDYGDAPDGPYPTLFASDGARHVPTGPRLGANRDSETNGQPTADGDDMTGVPDDEDGVVFTTTLTTSLFGDLTASVDVDLQNADSTANRLDAWIDFNRDGDWLDPGEQIFTNFDLGTADGVQTLDFTVPQDTGTNVDPGDTYARFRLSTAGSLSSTGAALDGEVEDYTVTIEAIPFLADFGDAPDGPYSTLLANDGAFHGPTGPQLGTNRDGEADAQPTAAADGDDTAGVPDDEDGITFTTTVATWMFGDLTATVQVDLQNADASSNRLDAWIDFNRDGDWLDAGEQIFANYDLGAANGVQTLEFTVPQDTGSNIDLGDTYARFRLSTAGGLLPTGAALDGEVEDYQVTIAQSPSLEFSPVRVLNTNAVPDDGWDWDPQVTTDGLGNWIAVWTSQDLEGTGDDDDDIFVSRSTDNGQTWTDPATLNTNAATDSGYDCAPQLTTDGAGTWIAVWESDDDLGGTIGADDDIFVSRSTDAGLTWSDPVALNTNAASDTGDDWYVQVTTDGAGTWIAVWDSGEYVTGTDPDIFVSRSDDNGLTWTAPVALDINAGTDSGNDYDAQVTTDGAGNWLAVWESWNNFDGVVDADILMSRSTNNGLTWTAPAALSNPAPDSRLDVYPQVTTDALGNWVAVWDSGDPLGGTLGTDDDILVSRSIDAGQTWTSPVALNTNAASDDGDDMVAQITTDRLGNWVAVWMSRENLDGNIFFDDDIFFATTLDFGDAPGSYLTQLISNGARHVPTGPRLGTERDGEFDGQPTTGADGDDATGVADEDGITFVTPVTTSLAADLTATIQVDLQNADPSANRLDAWIDFNRDGDWYDVGERIFHNYDLGTADGVQTLEFTVPQDTGTNVDPGDTYARFRLSTAGSLEPTGLALDGEVEDYLVTIVEAPPIEFSPAAALNTNAEVDAGTDNVPQVTTDGLGNWVAVWQSKDDFGGTIGTDSDILVSRSIDNGQTWTDPDLLNTNAGSDTKNDYRPQVTTDSMGNWVAVWYSAEDLGGAIGTDWDIFVSRSTDNGLTWTDPAALNSTAASDSGRDRYAQVTTDSQGNWVAVWASQEDLGGAIGTDYDILVSRSTDAGQTWTAAATLNTNATSDSGVDYFPEVATDSLGNWVAVWPSADDLGGAIGTDYDILVSRSTNNGLTWTAPAALTANATSDSEDDFWPQVTTDALGNWVAVWESMDDLGGTIGTDEDILVSRSTDNGQTWTAPAALNANAASGSGVDSVPQVTTDTMGNWVAVWDSSEDVGGAIGTDTDILLSRSIDSGQTWTAPVALNTNAGSDAGEDDRPQLTTDGLGNWVAAWESDEDVGGAIGTDYDILFATTLDFGDAPLSYSTFLLSDGARHVPVGPTLGANRDTEFDGQPGAGADGDDTTGVPNDEDGITFTTAVTTSLFRDLTASIEVDLQGADATSNRLDAWIDFNRDGDWLDAGEQIFTNYDLGTADGVQTLDFTIPQDTGTNVELGDTFARFRLSTAGGQLPNGLAADGEVEDYLVQIVEAPAIEFSPAAALNTNAGGDSGYDNAPQVTTDGAGNWVAVWQSSENLGGTIGFDTDIFVSRSTDNGRTWTDPAVLNTNAASDSRGDQQPQVTTDAAGNWVAVWYSSEDLGAAVGTDNDIFVARSIDNGLTWTDPEVLNTNAATDAGGDSTPQVTTDAAGNWVAVWHSWDDLGGTIGTDSDILVARSTDAGQTWTAPATLNAGASDTGDDYGPQVTTDGLGNWVAAWSSDEDLGGAIDVDTDIFVSRSTDAGQTWTAPAALNTNAATDWGEDYEPQVTTDAAGTWLAVWESDDDLNGTIGGEGDILVSRSTDAGQTWTAPAALNTNAATDSDDDFDYNPQVTTDALGNWVAVWTSEAEEGAPLGWDSDILVSRSADDGQTWSAPVPLNSHAASDDPEDEGDDWDENPQVTTDGHGNWIAVWSSSFDLGGNIDTDDDILFATTLDYGDAPDSYSTLLFSDGARHVPIGPTLGPNRDAEFNGQPSVGADDDDNDATDDEDGVTFGALVQGMANASVDLTAANAAGAVLNAWIDFNADGDWADANEQIFTDEPLSEGLNSLEFAIPGTAASGNTFARFRVSTATGLSYNGLAVDGEVEDYKVEILEDIEGPSVTAVLVKGRIWSSDFLDYLDNNGYGLPAVAPQLGYSIPAATQLDILPWIDIDTISIVFDEYTNVSEGDLALWGVNVGDYITDLSYGINSFTAPTLTTFVATWTLDNPFDADKVLIDLDGDSGGVSDPAGNLLDGEWVNGSDTFPSGNASAGGDFQFRLNIVPGDVGSGDNATTFTDFMDIYDFLGSGYNIYYDIDTNAFHSFTDCMAMYPFSGRFLPPGDPSPPPPEVIAMPDSGKAQDGPWTVFGTTGDDLFEFTAGKAPTVVLNGQSQEVPAGVTEIILDGAGGSDTARLYDSPGDDLFVTSPNYGTLSGDGYSVKAVNFHTVNAYATAGGHDVARMYDSAGDDVFDATPTEATLYRSGDGGYFNTANGFEEVHGFSTAGGHDVAMLYDSAGDDTYRADADGSVLSGDGFELREKYFETVHVRTDTGGNDTAYLVDAVLESGTGDSGTPSIDFGKAAWLYDFEQLFTRNNDSDEPVEETVDEVLEAFWSK